MKLCLKQRFLSSYKYFTLTFVCVYSCTELKLVCFVRISLLKRQRRQMMKICCSTTSSVKTDVFQQNNKVSSQTVLCKEVLCVLQIFSYCSRLVTVVIMMSVKSLMSSVTRHVGRSVRHVNTSRHVWASFQVQIL